MIEVTGITEDIRSVNEDKIKYLSKSTGSNYTIIHFVDGSEIFVKESIKTLEARINKWRTKNA